MIRSTVNVALVLLSQAVSARPREKQDLGTTKTPLNADVQGHDVLVVRLSKT
jgi:hypothetical protein